MLFTYIKNIFYQMIAYFFAYNILLNAVISSTFSFY